MPVTEAKTRSRENERGAALMTVIMITVLLGLACVFMLKAAGAVAGETTDVLSETKAYYSAEAGIQSTINVLRNNSGVTYKSAVTPSTSNASTDPSSFGRLSNAGYLTYADPTKASTDPNGRVIVDSSAANYQAYAVEIYDPDNTQTLVTFSGSMPATTAPAPSPSPNGTPNPNRSMVQMVQTDTTAAFSAGVNPVTSCTPLGAITLTNTGTGVASSQTVDTLIDYHVPIPKPSGSTRTIYATVTFNVVAGSVTAIVKSKVPSGTDANVYKLSDSDIKVYTDSTCTTPFQGNNAVTVLPGTTSPNLWVTVTPMNPYRLKLVAKGYGPGGAYKELEAVIQRNLFNNLSSPAAISMVGPGAQLQFDPGTANTLDILGGTNPSVAVSDATGLAIVNAAHTNGTISPAPVIAGNDLPDWQQSTSAMDTFISELRQTAQNNGRYFTSQPTCGQGVTNCFGNNTNGTGLTFCDTSCDLTQDGGGILVVTGTLSMSGKIGFKGLIIVTGSGGVLRSGNGNSTIQGNLVIAPYNPADLAAGFGSPIYKQNGGAGDVIDNFSVDQTFDGSSAISDFVLGVAEK